MGNLERFKQAQEKMYIQALNEIKNGKKETHWIWYIFPQLKGLGISYASEYYGIDDINEAIEYLNDEYLKNHLVEISTYLLDIDKPISDILGFPDDLKVKSSMTLFNKASSDIDIFQKVLDKFYDGEDDTKTLSLLNKE